MSFFDQEYRFFGPHAQKVQELVSNEFFESYIEILLVAGLVGKSQNQTSPLEKGQGTSVAKIHIDTIFSRQRQLEHEFMLVMLSDIHSDDNFSEQAELLFRMQQPSESQWETFNSYVRGGIDYLYDKLLASTSTAPKDQLNAIVDLLHEYRLINGSIGSDKLVQMSNY